MTDSRSGAAGAIPNDEQFTPRFPAPLHVGRPNTGSRERFQEYVDEMFDRRWFTNDGPLVQDLEGRIADYLGVRNCVAMCNGTLALEIGIRALGLTGEVIVPSFTFVATAHSLYWQGVTPVFADIDPRSHNLDPDAVRRMITPRTTGIIGVHLWGRAADVEGLQVVADEHGLKLMFDAAHAFACEHDGARIGRFGALEVLSFHATKFFNSFEGGAVVTDDDDLAATMRLMRNFGFMGNDNVIHPGTNGKMTEICAAMGLANLDILGDSLLANRRTYDRYVEGLAGVPGVSVLRHQDGSNHQYVVCEIDAACPVSRDELVQWLMANNVLARRYFYPGAHRMKPYRDLFPHAGLMLPQTEAIASRVMVLPAGGALTSEDVDGVVDLIRERVTG